MTENDQLELFIKSNIKCKCQNPHALTDHEYEDTIRRVTRIKKLIIQHGWDLSRNYHHYMNKLDSSCNAWNVDNSPYLILRADYQDRVNEISIPVTRR